MLCDKWTWKLSISSRPSYERGLLTGNGQAAGGPVDSQALAHLPEIPTPTGQVPHWAGTIQGLAYGIHDALDLAAEILIPVAASLLPWSCQEIFCSTAKPTTRSPWTILAARTTLGIARRHCRSSPFGIVRNSSLTALSTLWIRSVPWENFERVHHDRDRSRLSSPPRQSALDTEYYYAHRRIRTVLSVRAWGPRRQRLTGCTMRAH